MVPRQKRDISIFSLIRGVVKGSSCILANIEIARSPIIDSSKPMKCVGYFRVSTIGQSDDGISLELQRAKAESWAITNDCELVATFSEVMSGGKASNRLELQKALDLACKVKGVLIVYSLSRLARDVRDTLDIAERIERAGANLASITEKIDTSSAIGKMVFRLMSSLNQFEREQIAERVSAAMCHLRKSNRRISTCIPLGFTLADDGKTLLPCSAEQETVAWILDARARGISLPKIAQQLTATGRKTKYGGNWHPSTIKAILDRCNKMAN